MEGINSYKGCIPMKQKWAITSINNPKDIKCKQYSTTDCNFILHIEMIL